MVFGLRDDLFYRLNVVKLLTPAADRQEDIETLSERFVQTYANKHGRFARKLSADAKRILFAYDFPGNVRELANIIERAVIVSNAVVVEIDDLPESVRFAAAQQRRKVRPPTLAEVEADYLRETLAATKGNKSEAAKILGISRKNLYERLAREKSEAGERNLEAGRSEIECQQQRRI